MVVSTAQQSVSAVCLPVSPLFWISFPSRSTQSTEQSSLCCIMLCYAKSLQSCPTVRPHRWQPNRLPCPWDSPGKNTGVGCGCLLQCMKVKSESEVAQSCPTPSDPMDPMQPTRLLGPWDFPGKSTGVGCHCLT